MYDHEVSMERHATAYGAFHDIEPEEERWLADAYDDGFNAGQDAAHHALAQDIASWEADPHHSDCACMVCRLLRRATQVWSAGHVIHECRAAYEAAASRNAWRRKYAENRHAPVTAFRSRRGRCVACKQRWPA